MWNTLKEVATISLISTGLLGPTFSLLAWISHNFRSEEPQGCVVARRAKVWARKRTCSTLSTQIECNAVNAQHCGFTVESV